jgi:hypothetical protein
MAEPAVEKRVEIGASIADVSRASAAVAVKTRNRRGPPVLPVCLAAAGALTACGAADHPSRSGSYAENRRFALEHASAPELVAALDALEAWHAENETAAAGRLAPGREPAELAELEDRLGAALPDELRALYTWHDGTLGRCDDFAGPAFMAYHCLLSLEQALEVRRRHGWLLGVPDTWLPLLYFEEEYFYVVLDHAGAGALPVFHRLVESDDVVAFTNLRTMVETFLEAARSGVWHPDDDARVDWPAVEAIRNRRNPGTSPPWAA